MIYFIKILKKRISSYYNDDDKSKFLVLYCVIRFFLCLMHAPLEHDFKHTHKYICRCCFKHDNIIIKLGFLCLNN